MEGTKNATIFFEGIKRLFHVSSGLPWSESVKHMNVWFKCLQDSGYGPKERLDAIKGAVQRQRKMVRMVQEGSIRSLHRTRQEILAKMTEKVEITSISWFLKGRTSKVVKCQATPGGALAKQIERNLNKGTTSLERIKVIEEDEAP